VHEEQPLHCVSRYRLQADSCVEPMGQVEQLSQTRSEVAVALMAVYEPALHTVSGAHSLSKRALHGKNRYSVV
jgi:hypothetical protein